MRRIDPELRRQRAAEYHKQWYAKNRESQVRKNRERRELDREKDREKSRIYRAKNAQKVRDASKRFRDKNKEKMSSQWRWARLKRRYGVTQQQFEKQLAIQKNSCPICQRAFCNGIIPVIDHCHSSGMMRGILCVPCNAAEGGLKTPENVLRLYNYMNSNLLFYEENGNLASRLSDPVPELADSEGMESEARAQATGSARPVVSIVRLSDGKHKIRDRDNLVGGTKSLTDLVRSLGIIEADDEETIELKVEQKVVENPQEVGTLVTIHWP